MISSQSTTSRSFDESIICSEPESVSHQSRSAVSRCTELFARIMRSS